MHQRACASMFMCPRVRVRLCALSHSNSESEREAAAGQHGRIPIVKTSQSFHTEGLLSWDWDETMQGLGKGVREVFLGDNIPTVTHEEAPYVKHEWIQRKKKLFSALCLWVSSSYLL